MRLVAEQEISNAKKGWNDVTFTNPYTIDFSKVEGIMLGFTYTQKKGSTPECYPMIVTKRRNDREGICYDGRWPRLVRVWFREIW